MSQVMQLCWPFIWDLFCQSFPSNCHFQWPHKILQWHEDPEIIKFLYTFSKLADWERRDTISISTETGDIIHRVWLGGYCQSALVPWLDSAQKSNWRWVLRPWVKPEMSILESTSELVVLQGRDEEASEHGETWGTVQ